MKEKTIVSGMTLVASMVSYFYARQCDKDAVPYVMVGGFIGAVIGEAIVSVMEKRKKQEELSGSKNNQQKAQEPKKEEKNVHTDTK